MAPIDALYTELKDAREIWTELYNLLKRGQYDTASSRAAIENVSVDVIHQRALITFELIESLRPESDEAVSASILSARATELRTFLTNFRNNVLSSVNAARPHLRESTVIKDANNNFSWQFFDDQTNTANVELSANFSQISSSLAQILALVGSLLPLCKATAIADLSERAQALADVVRTAEILQAEVRKLAQAAGQSAAGAEEKDKGIQAILAGAQTINASLQALQQATDKEVASVNALVAQIKTIGASADTLEKQITAYQSTYDAFQKQLDARQKQFADFEANTKAALDQNQKRGAEIDRLMNKADTMIRGATTAGLSKSLEDTREAYGSRMFWARIGFLVSIALLSVSALPLAGHLLPGLFGNLVPAISEGAQNSPVGVLGKIVLLLPGTWLTMFFAKSFSEFFRRCPARS